ncbi:peptidase M61 [Piscinibacter sp. XHJ-5]|uniref:M61 family metallopeptidase n=1 Tax=Piscinibacter sp. XHJ-5 TaxID=3037797 RepID=UPI0024528E89|nr:peptidase M61 [Piscinibacter sp. XHJ-5]
MKRLFASIALAAAAGATSAQAIPAVGQQPYPGAMTLQVDATDLDRKIFRAVQSLPVRPGPLVLYYPRWLPGTHAPQGNASTLTGLQVRGNGQRIEWRRDTLDVHAFHLHVPAGVSRIELEFQFVSPLEGSQGQRVVATPDMLGLQWNTVLLYPAGYAASQITVQPSVSLPAGWSFGSALAVASRSGDTVRFKPVSAETLVDSPLFAGRHYQLVDLDPGAAEAGRPPVRLHIVADQPSQLKATPEQIALHRALVTQADKVFGTRHFTQYEFLLALSDQFGAIGLEHHQSSENGVKTGYFTDWAKTPVGRDLLAHEYAHSWNGKFRRPLDLLTPNFNIPMQNSLLWVYEGQTQYWGKVLAARSGLMNASDARDDLAAAAAWLEMRTGRAWRNLQDTTNEAIVNSRWHRDWTNWQRAADYYDEARLFWLEADMLIRDASKGQRSLDDFARAFFGVEPGRVSPLAYRFEDVVRELDRVQPHDWAGFLRRHLDRHDGGAPLEGLARSGWRLAWTDKPSEFYKALETRNRVADFGYSLGFEVSTEPNKDGHKIAQVLWGSPAFEAGVAPSSTLVAVNGRAYKAEWLKDQITEARDSGKPIELLVRSGDLYRTVKVAYRGGLRYPTLQRIEGVPDRLSEVLAPR